MIYYLYRFTDQHEICFHGSGLKEMANYDRDFLEFTCEMN